MKFFITSAFVAFLCAAPAVSAEATSSITWKVIIAALPDHLLGLQHPALADSSIMSQYAVADVTMGGAEESFAKMAFRFHDGRTSADLLDAYREANRSPLRLASSASNGIQVLSLDEFVTGPLTYDWSALNRKYPNIKAVLRLSQPAVVGSYAVVRVEMVGQGGVLWCSFVEIERNSAGEWRVARAVCGSRWEEEG